MPNRFIKESSLTSATLAQLSAEAERLFWRLVLVADDFGRFYVEPEILTAKCFPRKPKAFKTGLVKKWVDELTQSEAIAVYCVKNTLYGYFVNWTKYQIQRANHSKFPDPTPETICNHLLADANKCVSYPNSEERIPRTNTLTEQTGFARFWRVYPKKKSKGQAEKAWKSMKPDEPLQNRILHAIERAKTSKEWTQDQGQFIPYPATWLHAKGWEDEGVTLPERKTPKREYSHDPVTNTAVLKTVEEVVGSAKGF